MEFIIDRIKVNGPKADNSYTVSLELGEYQREAAAKLLLLPIDQAYKITVEEYDG